MPNNVIAENNDLGGCLTLTGTTPGVLWRLAHGWSRCCGRWLGSIAWGIVGGPALAQWREPYPPAPSVAGTPRAEERAYGDGEP